MAAVSVKRSISREKPWERGWRWRELSKFDLLFTTILNVKEHFTTIEMDFSLRDQDCGSKKEQTLSISFSQSDWFIFQNERF